MVGAYAPRDIRELRREDLLDDYLQIARSRGDALVTSASRIGSVQMRDILVHGAVRFELTSEELKELVLTNEISETDVNDIQLLGDLGRLVLQQNLLENDIKYGERLLTIAHEMSSTNELSVINRRTLIQHHVLQGDKEKAHKLLDQSPDIDCEFHSYLRAETWNPFIAGDDGGYRKWLDNFNEPFIANGIAPVGFKTTGGLPFGRLTTAAKARSVGASGNDPLVSVVLTTFKPEEAELVSSIFSLLNQTWSNLELIVVDDCSGDEYLDIFTNIEALDPRIRVVHAPVNRGTYVARNIGFRAATGGYITGQDDGDWSHPERLERQIQFMEAHPDYGACRIMAIRCDENLRRCRIGQYPLVINTSSLMVRREVYERAGDHLASRKDADKEYYSRLTVLSNGRVADLADPLSVIRILPESLSGELLETGPHRSVRTSFRSAYEYWHRHTPADSLKVTPGIEPLVKIPHRFEVYDDAGRTRQYDVVFAGDWQRYGGPQKSMLEEIAALQGRGYRVGIMNLEAARFMNEGTGRPLNNQIQKLINEGAIEEVFFDDTVRVHLLILRYPPILQFFTRQSSELRIDSMIIVANQAPSELDGSDVRYLVDACHANAKAAFGVSPRWVPQGPQVRDFLKLYLDAPVLAEFDMPGVLDLERWWHERLWYRSTVPVVGRHSRDNAMKWPADKLDLEKIYRTDGTYDIRIMGGHRTPLRVLDTKKVPTAWTVYKKDAMPVSKFLYTLDYFVFFQHPNAVEAFGRAILEALASGVVVILPKHFERVFGAAALYAEIDEVQELIDQLHSDFSRYRAQLRRSKAVLSEKFSYSSYARLVKGLLAGVL